MTSGPLLESLTRTPRDRKLLQREELVLEFTELFAELMDDENVTNSALAKRLGVTRGRVTQILSGDINLTLKTISDVLFALGFEAKVSAVKARFARDRKGGGA